ncbi:Soluble calcium-activated nucleotidase 1-like [Homarus americanus]|uniref:Soluble calcium-activated nucleotidase 1-like n=1 Tax=Homarus americanus TaxID=6706 RepID=A0A8J5N4G1_HOMAM|nr:Soluble calcium-activated nucleotidase 1-like [Homarus americanus]
MLENNSSVLDMRQAVFSRTPLSYRVGNSTLRVQTKFVTLVAVIGLISLLVLFLIMPASRLGTSNLTNDLWGHGEEHSHALTSFLTCSTYPLTAPVYSDRGYIKYRIAIVTDLDVDSKHPTEKNTWISFMKKGYLTVSVENQEVSVEWDKDLITLTSNMAYGGRGMELSELVIFNGKLYAVDDRTGIIYEIDLHRNKAIPWVILTDGSGREMKGFKSEWATVKDETLIVGGLGKEWTTSTGELVNHNPQWVKTITTHGFIEHHDWTKNYEKLRESVGIFFPVSESHRSTVQYCTVLEIFKNLYFSCWLVVTEVKHVGEKIDTHGFSSFKFIPGTKENLIVALKSEEVNGKVASFIMAINMAGKVLLPETKIGDYKFEGIEFV